MFHTAMLVPIDRVRDALWIRQCPTHLVLFSQNLPTQNRYRDRAVEWIRLPQSYTHMKDKIG